VRLIGLLLAVVVLAIALWLVFNNPKLGGGQTAPVAVAPAIAPPAAKTITQNAVAEDAAQKAAAEKTKAVKAAALAAQRAEEAAQADAIEQNMTPAQNRLNEDYAAQVGDTRPAPTGAGNLSTSANGN